MGETYTFSLGSCRQIEKLRRQAQKIDSSCAVLCYSCNALEPHGLGLTSHYLCSLQIQAEGSMPSQQ